MVILVFILGLIIGSFLNCLIYRLHFGGNILTERSHCPRCKRVLGFWDLLPVLSFVFLKGRCRYCRQPIDWQYPLVELATAISFTLVYSTNYKLLNTSYELLITSFLLVIFVYDLRYYLILDKVTAPVMVIAVLGNIFLLKIAWLDLLIGAVIGGGVFFLQYVLSRGRWVGGGDIRLGILLGLILGWQKTLLALFLAYLFGAIIGIILIIGKKKTLSSQIPFGTFLALTTWLSLLWGEKLINWYLGLFL